MIMKDKILAMIKARPNERWSVDDLCHILPNERESVRRACNKLKEDGEILGYNVMVYGVNKKRYMVK